MFDGLDGMVYMKGKGIDNSWTEPKVGIADTVQAKPLLTNIEPPPALSTDLWGYNDDTPTDPDGDFSLAPAKPSNSHQDIYIYNSHLSTYNDYEYIIHSETDSEQKNLVEDADDYLDGVGENLDAYAINSDTFDDIDLFDIDAVLEDQAEFLSRRKYRRGRGASTWTQRLEKWAGGVHVNWDETETAEWRILERLGYTRVPLDKETRDYIIRTACNEMFSHREINRLTTQLANTRAQLAFLPSEVGDDYSARREALQVEITGIEQTLANQKHWMAIKRAVQCLGRELELDDLMIRDNCLMQW